VSVCFGPPYSYNSHFDYQSSTRVGLLDKELDTVLEPSEKLDSHSISCLPPLLWHSVGLVALS